MATGIRVLTRRASHHRANMTMTIRAVSSTALMKCFTQSHWGEGCGGGHTGVTRVCSGKTLDSIGVHTPLRGAAKGTSTSMSKYGGRG
jgi:hypothetical protein